MLSRLSNKMFDSACQSGLICQTDKEIYQYGFEVTLLKCVHVVTMLLIGAIFRMLPEAGLFIIAYSSLRIYAGGFHAKTKIRCFIISCFMMIVVLLITKYYPHQLNSSFFSCVTLISIIIILWLSPVENVNKELDIPEKKHYKKRVYMIGSLHLLVLAILTFTGQTQCLIILCLSEVVLSIMLIFGKLQLTALSRRDD